MKIDSATFDLLPQKTSSDIDSQVNTLKIDTQINCVLKNKKTYAPDTLKGQYVGCTLIRLKRRRFDRNLSSVF